MQSLLRTTMNTRDLGGYVTVDGNKTLYNRIYRSDRQEYPCDEDISFLLGNDLTTIVDMRTEQDAIIKPSGFRNLAGFKYYNIPIKEGSNIPESVEAVPGSYIDIACSYNMCKVFETIADAETGVMFNCSAGKDRSGVVSAIILMLCGVNENDVISDYMLSKECNRERFNLLKKNCPDIDLNIVIPRESYMRDFMKLFYERFGDVREYFSSIGLSEDRVNRIRSKLLDNAVQATEVQ